MLRRVINLLFNTDKKKSRIQYRKNDDAFAEIFTQYQIESMPQKNHDVVIAETETNGNIVVIAEQLETSINQGELKINGLDADNKKISYIYLKNSGDIEIKNGAGSTILFNDGAITFANGASITSDGNFVTKSGISLSDHTHGLSGGRGDDGGALSGTTDQPS